MIDAYAEACAAREAMHAAGNEYVRLRRQLGPVVGPQRAALDALSARVRDANLHLGMAITALAPVTSEAMDPDEARAHVDEAREEMYGGVRG